MKQQQQPAPNAAAAKQAAHTPGPWFTCGQSTKPHNHALVGIGNGATHVGYASVTPAMTLGEADANARLIAAAPELLAALKALSRGKSQDTYWIEKARAAIAKAEGSAQ